MSPHKSFCTLFDSHYLSRALVMYRSLAEMGENFSLYAVCFDDLSYQIIQELKLPGFIAISLADFESPALLRVKPDRSTAEYCWTCTPHVIRYVLDNYELPDITYVDADLCFFAPPSLLFSEFDRSSASVLITEHRFTPRYDRSATSGIYCVQFMTFRSDTRGMKVLQWWQDRCTEWCYARFEDGKFGDQKYLDDWTQRFEGIHVLQHLGGGVAPWNVQQYDVASDESGILISGTPLVFYHFHGYKHYKNGIHNLGAYRLTKTVIDSIYRPYVKNLAKAQEDINRLSPNFDRSFSIHHWTWKTPLQKLLLWTKGELNEYSFGPN